MSTDVSVLIPVLNEGDRLGDAAEAMLAQKFDGELEFLFIDGGSEDRSPQILAELAAADARVRVLANPAQRTPHALNIGLRAARGQFIARMDAHTIYPDRYLASGVARLQRGGIEWVSGPQLALGMSPGSVRIARALSAALGKGGAQFRHALASEQEVDTGFTGVWLRTTLERHRGWDEEWLNDQDGELAARIRKAGGRIVCIPEMTAQYIPRETLPALARQYLTYGTYRVKTARRHPESLRRSQLLAPGLTGAAAMSVLAPRPLRRAARRGVAAYAGTLAFAGARAAQQSGVAEAVSLPAVWATMHFSYGVGFLRGCVRYGPPLRAISDLLRFGARMPGSAPGPGAELKF